jgi:ubiquinone/menaquinone biosynthesis C-methylase UbiE
MYHRVAVLASGHSNLSGISILDLACGRGGGLAFLVDYFNLSEGVGIDLCSR